MRLKEITKLDMWNINKTGFQFGYRKAQLFVTMDQNKPLCIIDLENCD